MDNKAMEANRPLDQEKLSPELSEQVAGGFQDNTTNTNAAGFINTASFNTANKMVTKNHRQSIVAVFTFNCRSVYIIQMVILKTFIMFR